MRSSNFPITVHRSRMSSRCSTNKRSQTFIWLGEWREKISNYLQSMKCWKKYSPRMGSSYSLSILLFAQFVSILFFIRICSFTDWFLWLFRVFNLESLWENLITDTITFPIENCFYFVCLFLCLFAISKSVRVRDERTELPSVIIVKLLFW